jgi:hypothetical protein
LYPLVVSGARVALFTWLHRAPAPYDVIPTNSRFQSTFQRAPFRGRDVICSSSFVMHLCVTFKPVIA